MRKSGVAEKYVRVVQDMYERSRTVVRCDVGQTEEFKVEVGLHQGSALSPFLFAIVMDQLSEEVRQESPWTMMFADDIVICSESREQVEENLERWRFALERRGMKVSRSKTEYMCVNEREGSGTVRLQGEEVKKVQEFKYLGSTVQSNGECGKEGERQIFHADGFLRDATNLPPRSPCILRQAFPNSHHLRTINYLIASFCSLFYPHEYPQYACYMSERDDGGSSGPTPMTATQNTLHRDPYAPSCGWWAYGEVSLRLSFGLCIAESRRQRLGHRALACMPQPQAWLHGGAPVTPVRVT
ncbi:hypothetical protein QTP70_005021 [Hemibagrus guttatus]|uniref:ribonuclease H n=1 Tax=Hemibagrus guttatus TaxID=175788 RepID=A0AAE0V1V7_9TELE|nr:hypothetical protein QTP70_005021 [Hemibagrus guttatus]